MKFPIRPLYLLGSLLAARALIAQPDPGSGKDEAAGRGRVAGPGQGEFGPGPHGPGEHRPGGQGRELQRRLREKFDADKDGKLDPEEAKLARQEFRRIDEERRAQTLKKYDVNGNGQLDEEELATMRKEWSSRLDHAKDDTRKKFDTNGDGTLDDAEKAAAEAVMREKWQQRRTEILKRFDTNGDGALSDEEKARAKKEMPRRGGPPHEKQGKIPGEKPGTCENPDQSPQPQP